MPSDYYIIVTITLSATQMTDNIILYYPIYIIYNHIHNPIVLLHKSGVAHMANTISSYFFASHKSHIMYNHKISSHQIPSGVTQMTGIYGGYVDTTDGYIEQNETADKRIDQLTREKRDLIFKNLEENKMTMDVKQKLSTAEKDIIILKSKITKLTLQNERNERKNANILDKNNGSASITSISSPLKNSSNEQKNGSKRGRELNSDESMNEENGI